jgi:GH43 family beta-xylosidase
MFVLESSGPDPWESAYTLKGPLNTFDQFAIDGTYFQHSTGLYHVYSCWFQKYMSWPANLCITKCKSPPKPPPSSPFADLPAHQLLPSPVSNPYTVSSNLSQRATLSVPTQPWEKTPYGRTINDRLSSNEGPQQLSSPAPDPTTNKTRRTFLIYSAARSDNRNYCLGQLELVGTDPMNVNDWCKTTKAPVFYQDAREHAYGVGHASFTTSPDGRESWMVYHGMRDPSNGWKARTIRTQRFGWSEDGRPVFPRPGYGPYQVPSGQV